MSGDKNVCQRVFASAKTDVPLGMDNVAAIEVAVFATIKPNAVDNGLFGNRFIGRVAAWWCVTLIYRYSPNLNQ